MTDDTARANDGQDQRQDEQPHKRPAKAIPPPPPGTTFEQLLRKALNTPPSPSNPNKRPAK